MQYGDVLRDMGRLDPGAGAADFDELASRKAEIERALGLATGPVP